MKKLSIINIDNVNNLKKYNKNIKKKMNMYIYIFIFFFIFLYIFSNYTLIFEGLFMMYILNQSIFIKIITYFKQLLQLSYIKASVYKIEAFISSFFLEFYDIKRRLKFFKNSEMDWSLNLVNYLPLLKKNPIVKKKWKRIISFWDFRRKKSLDFNSIRYRLLWIKYLKDFDFFVKINFVPFKRFIFFKDSGVADSFKFTILDQLLFYLYHKLIDSYVFIELVVMESFESLNFYFLFDNFEWVNAIVYWFIDFSFFIIPIFYLIFIFVNWFLNYFFEIFIFLIQDVWVYLLKLKIYEIDLFFSIYIYGKEQIYFIYFQLESILGETCASILNLLKAYLLLIIEYNRYSYFIIKNIIFNISINETKDFYEYLSVISTYFRRYGVLMHPLELGSLHSKYVEHYDAIFNSRDHPLWNGFFRTDRPFSFWQRLYLSKFISNNLEQSLRDRFFIGLVWKVSSITNMTKYWLWISFLNIIYCFFLLIITFVFFGSFWYFFFKKEIDTISDDKFDKFYWLWIRAKNNIYKYLDERWVIIFEYRILETLIPEEFYLELTELSDKEEFEDDEAVAQKEFFEIYIDALKTVGRKRMDRFSKYEYLNNKFKLFRIDQTIFNYIYDYTLSFRLLKSNFEHSNFYMKLEFLYLKIYFIMYDWFYFILRTNRPLTILHEKITSSLFWNKFTYYIRIYTNNFYIVLNNRTRIYIITKLSNMFYRYNRGNILNKVNYLNKSLNFESKKNNKLFLNIIQKLDFLENYVKSIKMKNKIRNLTIFKYRLGPSNLQEFFYDLTYKNKFELNNKEVLEKHFLKYVKDDRFVSRIFNLFFVVVFFSYGIYKLSFLVESLDIFLSDSFIHIFYIILLMNKYLAALAISIYFSFFYFWKFLNHLFWEISALYPIFIGTSDWTSIARTNFLYFKSILLPLKIHSLLKNDLKEHFDIFNVLKKSNVMQYDLGFKIFNSIYRKRYEFQYIYNQHIQSVYQSKLRKNSLLFYVYKYAIYTKCLLIYVYSLIKFCFWHISNKILYIYGRLFYGFSYPRLILQIKRKGNRSNIYEYKNDKSNNFAANFQYVYIYKHIENLLKRKQYSNKISGFLQSYFYRNKNTWNFYQRNEFGEQFLKYPLIVSDKFGLFLSFLKNLFKTNKEKRVILFTKSSDFLSYFYTKKRAGSSLHRATDLSSLYNIYGGFAADLNKNKKEQPTMSEFYIIKFFRKIWKSFNWKPISLKPGRFSFYKNSWYTRRYEEIPYVLREFEKKNPMLNIWNQLYDEERPANVFSRYMYMLHEFIWRGKFVFHRTSADVRAGLDKYTTKIFRKKAQVVATIYREAAYKKMMWWRNYRYNWIRWNLNYSSRNAPFENNFTRRKLREFQGDFTNDFFLRNLRYKEDLNTRLNMNDKFSYFYYSKFFEKENSIFWKFEVMDASKPKNKKRILWSDYHNKFKPRFRIKQAFKSARRLHHIVRILNYRQLTEFWNRSQIWHLYKIKGTKKKIVMKVSNWYSLTYHPPRRVLENQVSEHVNFIVKLKKFIVKLLFGNS
jgi:hypothetical protein